MKARRFSQLRPFLNAPNLVAGVVCFFVFIFLVYHIFDQHRYIRSDDALVQAHFTTLAAKVPGIVTAILVDEHSHVKKGQILARIDDREYQSRLAQATHARESAEIQLKNAEQDYARAKMLYQAGELSQQSFELAKTNALSRRLQLHGETSKRERAEINDDYTVIRAPDDGIIALRGATPGQEVQEGDALFGIVYPKEKWIEARIKETDLGDLRIGESVRVEIDALPGREFKGRLESLSPTTEGLSAAITPDNSAGNFTKYVQRVPVKITLALNAADQELVRAGLSANIRIRRKI